MHRVIRRKTSWRLLASALMLFFFVSSHVDCSRPATHCTARRHRVMGRSRPVAAWGEWDLDDDFWESAGSRLLDWVLRRKAPEEPHPLRMQRWTIRMSKFPFRRIIRHMEFYADGTCEVESEEQGKKSPSRKGRPGKGSIDKSLQGKWRYDKYGLNWEMEEGGVRHFYHAELIWHSFGDRPKMHCGVCVRDRGPNSILPSWLFRPLVGTFSGFGNGTDTYYTGKDTSGDRRFGTY